MPHSRFVSGFRARAYSIILAREKRRQPIQTTTRAAAKRCSLVRLFFEPPEQSLHCKPFLQLSMPAFPWHRSPHSPPVNLPTAPPIRLVLGQAVPDPDLDAFQPSAPAAPEAPSAPPGRRHAASRQANPYGNTSSARNVNDSRGSVGGRGIGGGAGGATPLAQGPRKHHESPGCSGPIAVTVARTRQSGSNPAGRSGTSGAAGPGTSAAEISGGAGGRETGESSSAQSARETRQPASLGCSGGKGEWSGDASGPSTPSAPPRIGERGGRLSGGGGGGTAGVFGEGVSMGLGSGGGGGGQGGGVDDVEEVAKKLDFHTVFD